MAAVVKRFGRIANPEATAQFVQGLPLKHVPRFLVNQEEQRDVFLWEAKNKAEPDWVRIYQGIGDCVSMGMELCCTCLLWMMHVKGAIRFEAEAASEAIYGGSRVEVHNGKPQFGKLEDGSVGAWAAEFVNKYGVLLRLDYSKQTGNSEHDLRVYDGKESSERSFDSKARRWGYFGCGGKDDKGALDDIARKFPVKSVAPVRDVDEMAAVIDAGCPCTIASDVGFEGKRNSEGVIRARGSWGHQMCVLGKKYTPGKNRFFRIFNSWNDYVADAGPDPGIEDPSVTGCSFWCVDDDMQRIIRQQDTFAYSDIEGFIQTPVDPVIFV